VILLGATLRLEGEGSIPGVDVLKGTGSTLTSYVYNNSPAGEGAAPQKGLRRRLRPAGARGGAELRRRPPGAPWREDRPRR